MIMKKSIFPITIKVINTIEQQRQFRRNIFPTYLTSILDCVISIANPQYPLNKPYTLFSPYTQLSHFLLLQLFITFPKTGFHKIYTICIYNIIKTMQATLNYVTNLPFISSVSYSVICVKTAYIHRLRIIFYNNWNSKQTEH